MSLKVWLPLNGTLENKGLLQFSAINNVGAVVNSSGKIGSCYSFNGSNQRIEFTHDKTIWNDKEISIAMWYKYSEGNTTCTMVDIAADLCLSYTYSSPNVRFNYWRAYSNNGTRTGDSGSGNYYDASVWHHVVFTCDHNINKIYVDGVLDASFDRSSKYTTNWKPLLAASYNKITLAKSAGSNPYGSGYLNDVRIYDHCLSAAEVHEISQGLVLHYKLDGFQSGYGNPNLYIGSKDFSGSWVNGNNWTTATETYQGFTVKQRSATWGGLCQNVACTQNDIFTVSFYAKVDSGGQIMSIHRSSLGNVTTGLSILGGNFSSGTNWITTSQDGTQWKRYWATVQITSADITYLQWRIENNQSGKNLYVCGMKLEKGSSHTDWSPAANEGSFNIISDSSGYGHNGSIYGTIQLISGSPRYSTAIELTSTSSHINVSGLATSGFGSSYSFVWWAKSNSKTNMHWGFSDGIRLNGLYNGNLWNTGDSSNNPLYIPGTTTGISVTEANVWHHWAMTGDGTTCKVYKDGVHVANAKTWKAISGTSLWFNGWQNATNYTTSSLALSDFRLYCTALSADDIKQLYQVSAKVDNLQGLHTFEIKETNRNLLAGRLWSNGYNQHNPSASLFTNFNSNGEYQFTANGTSAGSEYIPINPTGHTYEYDYTISVNAGNQFYIGFERYDANKTARSNNACVYTYATKPSVNIVKQHFTGTVNLSTDGTNPCAFIALRILNGWSGTTSGVTGIATIHSLSLREIGTKQNPKLTKQGQFIEEELKEETNMKLHKNGIIETNNLIER